jgi:hypothetical protein
LEKRCNEEDGSTGCMRLVGLGGRWWKNNILMTGSGKTASGLAFVRILLYHFIIGWGVSHYTVIHMLRDCRAVVLFEDGT